MDESIALVEFSKRGRRAYVETVACARIVGLKICFHAGDLDATVHLGHPGSIASLWQQAGRAGRDARSTSAAIVVCWDSPIDQHFARCGGDLLERPMEPAALQVANESVLADQLVCAAAEAPLEARDRPFFALACGCGGGDCGAYDRALAMRKADRSLREAPGGGWAAAPHAADHARSVSLRVVDPVTFAVKCGGAVVDEVPYSRAFYELYEGAVYLIQAAPYLVTRLDVMTHEATVKRLGACDYITSSPGQEKGANFPPSKAPAPGGFPLVSADAWTSDRPSERCRRVDGFFRTARARHTRVEATSRASRPGRRGTTRTSTRRRCCDRTARSARASST